MWLPDPLWLSLATLWRSPVPPDPPWWLSTMLWWFSAPPWSSLAMLWRSPVPPDPPWWLSTMLWWSSAQPAPPWPFAAMLWWSSALSDPLWWLSTMLWWSTVPLWLYASLAFYVSSCWRVRGRLWQIFCLTMRQMFSIGERSGQPGQFSTQTLLLRSHAVVIAAVCGSLSRELRCVRDAMGKALPD